MDANQDRAVQAAFKQTTQCRGTLMQLSYLATPYSKFPRGLEAAFIEACKLTARLIETGLHVYSPIAHTHPVAIHGKLDAMDQNLWKDFDAAMLNVCRVLIVAHMDGWEESSGIAHEIEFFEKRNRPIFDLDVKSLTMVRRVAKG